MTNSRKHLLNIYFNILLTVDTMMLKCFLLIEELEVIDFLSLFNQIFLSETASLKIAYLENTALLSFNFMCFFLHF